MTIGAFMKWTPGTFDSKNDSSQVGKHLRVEYAKLLALKVIFWPNKRSYDPDDMFPKAFSSMDIDFIRKVRVYPGYEDTVVSLLFQGMKAHTAVNATVQVALEVERNLGYVTSELLREHVRPALLKKYVNKTLSTTKFRLSTHRVYVQQVSQLVLMHQQVYCSDPSAARDFFTTLRESWPTNIRHDMVDWLMKKTRKSMEDDEEISLAFVDVGWNQVKTNLSSLCESYLASGKEVEPSQAVAPAKNQKSSTQNTADYLRILADYESVQAFVQRNSNVHGCSLSSQPDQAKIKELISKHASGSVDYKTQAGKDLMVVAFKTAAAAKACATDVKKHTSAHIYAWQTNKSEGKHPSTWKKFTKTS